jgi:hypothetical protein
VGTKFQVTIRCDLCQHRYKRTMEAEDEQGLDEIDDPPCPKCTKAAKAPRGMAFDTGRAPAVGGSLQVRAVDFTADLVMRDHGMTDLRSDVREGESMAPKLPPRQQAMADNMFARRNSRGINPASIMGLSPRAVMQAAVSGRFNTPDTPNPVAIQHARRDAAPTHIIAGDGIKSARRS